MSKSNNRVALKSVIVVREGKRVSPPIGKSFPFTEDEITALEESNPTAIRKAVNEDQEADLAEVIALSNTNTRVNSKNVKPGAGKTSAMADGMDGTTVTGEGGSDSANGQTAATRMTITDIKAGIADLSNDDLTAALEAERAHADPRDGAIKAYEAEIAKRNAPADDDL
jgi:hypothetical protein